ncbi:MAG: hypothetical protein U0353_06335 [Sandaracinus sp.]
MTPRLASVALCVLLAACDTTLGMRADVGSPRDGALRDATTDDAPAAIDAPLALDAYGQDSSSPDAGPPDAGPPDAGAADAGPVCPPPGDMDCSPGTGTGEGAECTLSTSCFLRDVQRAIAAVVAEHPEWFDTTAGPTHVLDVEAYMNAVVAAVVAGGLCAIRDPNAGDEITVKWNNAGAENFDILTASEDVRSGSGIYTSTCSPAWW